MGRDFKPTYLYIKQHNITGLKYFGKTTAEDPSQYLGSGILWRRHLEKYGNNVTTTIYGYFTDKNLLIKEALTFSKNNNIVKSKDWANLQEENGVGGGDNSASFTEESRKKISERHKGVNNSQSKLTEDQVIEIYHSMESPELLSEKFKVGTGQIFGIKRKVYYSSITSSISSLPGTFKGKKRVRSIIPIDIVKVIYLLEETYSYFKKTYGVSRTVVKNIKERRSFKKYTEGLGKAGCVKKYNLTNQDTVDIFNSPESLNILAKKYNVHQATIRNIKNGTSRKFFKDDY
jgi:hypothetical protein